MLHLPAIPPFVPRENVRPVVSVSGGKDSTATYLLALESAGPGPSPDLRGVCLRRRVVRMKVAFHGTRRLSKRWGMSLPGACMAG